MKNQGILYACIVASVLLSCGQAATKNGSENQKTTDKDLQAHPAAASVVTPESAVPEKSPDGSAAKETREKTGSTVPGTSGSGSTAPEAAPGNKEILAHIDTYLRNSVQFRPEPGGGFTNGIVTLTNTLPDASFQKVLLELRILNEDGSLVRTDYYPVINIEAAGGSKIVKLPESKTGNKISAHVVKVKSEEITEGEFVLTGNQ